MKTLSITIALLAFGLLVAPAPAADEPQGDLANFQGSWTAKIEESGLVISLEIDGKAMTARWTKSDGTKVETRSEIRLSDRTSPRNVDFINTKDASGDKIQDRLAIYKIDGENIDICTGGPGADRPTEFKDDGPATLMHLSRNDLAKFQGSWTAKVEKSGLLISMEIKGKAVTAKWSKSDGTEVDIRGELRLNEQARPRTVDFSDFKDASGELIKDRLGLYRIEGDRIAICNGSPGSERPIKFESSDVGSPTILMTLDRKKN